MHTTTIFFPSVPIKLFKEKMRTASPSRRPVKYTSAGKFGHFTCTSAATETIIKKLNNSIRSPISDGSLEENGLIYRQNILIRSFEIGFDKKLTLAALANYLQDTALNHHRMIGLMADGFGSTPEMAKRDLIWVICNLQIIVDLFPSWLDEVEVDTWAYPTGQISLGRDWFVRDAKTGQTLAQATSNMVVVFNKKTRKLCKLSKEIKEELAPYMTCCDPTTKKKSTRILPFDVNTADYVRTGLTPRWNDLDLNQHVNNVQYINWFLENVPRSLMEGYKLSAINLEYQKECNMNNVLKSLYRIVKNGTHFSANDNNDDDDNEVVELDHLLLLENGTEIAKAKTMWKPREEEKCNVPSSNQLCNNYNYIS